MLNRSDGTQEVDFFKLLSFELFFDIIALKLAACDKNCHTCMQMSSVGRLESCASEKPNNKCRH